VIIPVQRALKFSHVLGVRSEYNSKTTRPAGKEEMKHEWYECCTRM